MTFVPAAISQCRPSPSSIHLIQIAPSPLHYKFTLAVLSSCVTMGNSERDKWQKNKEPLIGRALPCWTISLGDSFFFFLINITDINFCDRIFLAKEIVHGKNDFFRWFLYSLKNFDESPPLFDTPLIYDVHLKYTLYIKNKNYSWGCRQMEIEKKNS